jgi:transposase
VLLCREIGLFTQAVAAVDGSKFKAVNSRDRNFTATKLRKRMEQVTANIVDYLRDLDAADRHEGELAEAKGARLRDKIELLRRQMRALKVLEVEIANTPGGRISLTDPDARAMATSGRLTGIVAYNVQTAVEAEHHLIVAHDVIMTGSDRGQLAAMSHKAKEAMGVDALEVLADRGYFSGEEILACEAIGVIPIVPKPHTSGARADGRFGKQGFYLCSRAGRLSLPGRPASPSSHDNGREGADPTSLLGPRQLPGLPAEAAVHPQRRTTSMRTWSTPCSDAWTKPHTACAPAASWWSAPSARSRPGPGSAHLLTKRLKNVKTEISLHVLAYNLKRWWRSSAPSRSWPRRRPDRAAPTTAADI